MTEEAQVNGPSEGGKFIDSIDPEDPEYIRQLRRPAEIKEDVRQMEQRKRVSLILNSEAFREELEQIIESQIKSGPHPASLIALQQISELLLPQSTHSTSRNVGKGVSSPVVPIADIRGVESLSYTKAEKHLRNKVASCYRLVDLFGWTHNIYNHITARLSQDSEHFLINPFGLLYHEVTAATLVKVDMQGEVLDPGSTSFGINKAGFLIHSVIHAARPDIKAIIHLHTPSVTAISCMKCGLLPVSQESLICGDASYHDYHGIVVDEDERESLGKDLGPVNKIMFLRNHGVVCCGETVEEAFYLAMNLVAACEMQMRLLPIGLDNIVTVDDETKQKVQETVKSGGGGVDMKSQGGRKWKVGEMEYEALMRLLDNAGYRTGYQYRQLVERIDVSKGKSTSDVEIPPTSSSHLNDDDVSSPLKVALERQKKHVRTEWLASPNTYSKTEIEETGTPNPKKITKWVQDGSPQKTSTPIKVDTKNQFAPIGDNPAELKKHQKKVREHYYKDTRTAGPQSRILEGTTWEEASRMRDGNLSGTGDIVVGAASKGIIQREHQHNAVVYKQYYAANPFESMTDDEIQKYKTDIEKKNKGDAGEVEEEPQVETTVSEIEQTPKRVEEWGFSAQETYKDKGVRPLSGPKMEIVPQDKYTFVEESRPKKHRLVEAPDTVMIVHEEETAPLIVPGEIILISSAPPTLERDVPVPKRPPPPKSTQVKTRPPKPEVPLRRTQTLQERPSSRPSSSRPSSTHSSSRPNSRPYSGEFFMVDTPTQVPPPRPALPLSRPALPPSESTEPSTSGNAPEKQYPDKVRMESTIDDTLSSVSSPPKHEMKRYSSYSYDTGSTGDDSAPAVHLQYSPTETNVDEDLPPSPVKEKAPSRPVSRSQSAKTPSQKKLVAELKARTLERSQSDRRGREGVMNGDDEPAEPEKPESPSKSDTLKSIESGDGQEKHGDGSPTKDKKKKGGKFRMPSFSVGKKKK